MIQKAACILYHIKAVKSSGTEIFRQTWQKNPAIYIRGMAVHPPTWETADFRDDSAEMCNAFSMEI